MTIHVTVSRVSIPAMSTIGFGFGTDEQGRKVSFLGDHRPMRDIGEAILYAAGDETKLPEVDLDVTSVISIEEA